MINTVLFIILCLVWFWAIKNSFYVILYVISIFFICKYIDFNFLLNI